VAGPPLVDQDELAVDPLGAGSESRIVRSLAEIDPEDENRIECRVAAGALNPGDEEADGVSLRLGPVLQEGEEAAGDGVNTTLVTSYGQGACRNVGVKPFCDDPVQEARRSRAVPRNAVSLSSRISAHPMEGSRLPIHDLVDLRAHLERQYVIRNIELPSHRTLQWRVAEGPGPNPE
jgi:hypothetical protein